MVVLKEINPQNALDPDSECLNICSILQLNSEIMRAHFKQILWITSHARGGTKMARK